MCHTDNQRLAVMVELGDITRMNCPPIKSRDIYHYDALLDLIRREIIDLQSMGILQSLRWVPRNLNVEADELCNAILDKEAPDTTKRSTANRVTASVELLNELLRMLQDKRVPTIRTLPHQLAKHWRTFIHFLVDRYRTESDQQDRLRLRLIFMIAPHLLTVNNTVNYIRGRADFVALRVHLIMLLKPAYLDDCIYSLRDRITKHRHPARSSEPALLKPSQIQSFCARGMYAKCLGEGDATIAEFNDTNVETIRKGFPTADLPPHIDPNPRFKADVTFKRLRDAVKSMKNGKATGLSGWCRELLYPVVVLHAETHVQLGLTTIFSDITNARLSEPEQEFLRSFILVPLAYASKPGKVRAIIITDIILKAVWKIVLRDVASKDHALLQSGQVFGKPGQAGLAVCAMQASLSQGYAVVSLDASNAFPSIARSTFIDHMTNRPEYVECIPLLNMMYTYACTARWYRSDPEGNPQVVAFIITDGCLQGCVSGPHLYAVGTLKTAAPFRKHLCQVTDDSNLVGPEAIRHAKAVIEAFSKISQKMDGPKMKVYLPHVWNEDCKIQELAALEDPIFKGDNVVCSDQCFGVLGGAISAEVNPTTDSLTSAMKKLGDRLRNRIAAVLALDCSVQCKMLILRHLPYGMTYAARTTFHPRSQALFLELDQLILQAVGKVLPDVNLDLHSSTFTSSIEDGGVGFMPIASVHHNLQAALVDQASRFLEVFGLRMQPQDFISKPIRYVWRMNTGGAFNRFDRDGRTFRTGEFRSWLDCRPTTSITRIDDRQYRFQIDVILDNLRPCGVCKDVSKNLDLSTMTRADFTHHFFTCQACATGLFHNRHQEVLHAIRRTNRFHGVVDSVPTFFEAPLPGNSKGGPDLMVFAEESHAVDVVCAFTPRVDDSVKFRSELEDRYSYKIRKYKEFQALSQYTVVPFVVSHLGVISKQTRDQIQTWKLRALEPTYIDDLYNNVQMAIIRSQFNMHEYWLKSVDPRVQHAISVTAH
jgi:hypothetical protein